MKDNRNTDIQTTVTAPVSGKLPPQERMADCLRLSDLAIRMATHVICHTIVDYEERLAEERFSVASAFLQRVTSTHLCNHKLTKEGIVLRYKGEAFQLHEEFKTMTLTRSVYEHLVMFYFLYEHPATDEERRVVWNCWKINSKKNLMENISAGAGAGGGRQAQDEAQEIEALRREIFATRLGMECCQKLDEWTAPDKPTQNGCIAFFRKAAGADRHATAAADYDVRRVSYNQAWRYIFGRNQGEMDMLYRHLSIHSHPIYDGLLQYQDQGQGDEGFDCVPLYLSACFLACLCRLFLRLLPQGMKMFDDDFTQEEIRLFNGLGRVLSGK